MDITALSTAMSQTSLLNQVGAAVLSMSMDMVETAGEGMIQVLESAVTPELGSNIDIRV